MRIILTTFPDRRTAERTIRGLVEGRLIACGTIVPARSIYRWKGRIESSSEHLSLLKTTTAKAPAVVEYLSAKHPYEVPEIVVVRPGQLSGPYEAWLRESVRPPMGSR